MNIYSHADAMHAMESTQVAQQDMPSLEPTYVNAPDDLDQAVDRILHVEMLLEDLVRATEIAQITNQWHMLDSFVSQANDYLAQKIQIQQPDFGPMHIQVVTGTLGQSADAEVK